MDWKSIATDVAKAAPVLGSLLGGPAGGAIGALVSAALGTASDPAAVQQALATNPDAAVKLRQIEADQSVALQALLVQSETAKLQAETAESGAVNSTMQVEAKADHWPTYSWRPFIGFCVGFNTAAASVLVLAVYVPVMFGNVSATGAMAQLPTTLGALAAINATVLPILGIASWFRGKAQADPAIANDMRG